MRNLLTDTDYLPLWPCVVVLEDCYVPELAAACLEACEHFHPDYLRSIIRRVAIDAEMGLTEN